MNRTFLGYLAATALTLAAACGGDEPARSNESAGRPAGTLGTARITGSVEFEGIPPAPTAIKMDADPQCKLQHPEEVMANDVVVNENLTLKWVFVHVKEGVNGSYAPPAGPVVLDQRGCRYEPHVFGIMVDQRLKILNSDPTLHNVHAVAKNSRSFNLAMPRQGMELERRFQAPEVMVRIKCDVHPWMETWCGVLDHPFFAVTGDDGGFELNKLPAGTYTVEAWHEEYGTQSRSVTVSDGEITTLTFTLGPDV